MGHIYGLLCSRFFFAMSVSGFLGKPDSSVKIIPSDTLAVWSQKTDLTGMHVKRSISVSCCKETTYTYLEGGSSAQLQSQATTF